MQSQRKSVAASRGNQTLQPIQTAFPPKSPQHRPAPPRPEDASFGPSGERVPLRAPKSQSSRSSLRNLFLRNKSSRNFAPRSDSPLPAISESQRPSAANSSSSATPSPTPAGPAPTLSVAARELAPPALNKSPSNLSLQSSANPPKDKTPRPIPSWEPPPLFKAYPQALKHATLPTPNLSAETILKIDSHDHRKISRNGRTTVNVDAGVDQNGEDKKKGEKIKKHSRTLSDHIRKADWSRKIYMIVTSGYLLQYSPDGPFDRQPEKIMELGKNSVAFASDVLPGKHWVLQISQTVEGKNSVTFDTRRTLFSRIGLADARKSTKSMLLVFETPEELASWLTVIRREIETLGGKEFVPESPAEETPDLHRFSSFRVNRNSSVFEQPRPQMHQPPPPMPNNRQTYRYSAISTSNPPEKTPYGAGPAPERTNVKQVNRRSVIQRPSTDAPSVSTLNTPSELDRLRDGSRLSYVSTGTRTVPSSRGSSPGMSSSTPRTMNFPKGARLESSQNDRTTIAPLRERSSTSPSNTYSIDEESVQNAADATSRPYAGTAFASNFSRPTPNFSVPGFSRRYSTAIRSPPSSAHSNRPALQSSQPLTSPPESPINTQFMSSSNRTVSAPLQHIRTPRSSNSIRKRTSTVNEESRTSSAMTSHSELSDSTDMQSAASRVAKLRARRYSAYETGLRPGALAGESVPELPKKRNDIDPLSKTIREINLKEDPAETLQPGNIPEPQSRPLSMQFSSPSTHHLDQGITFEILSPRSRMHASNTNSNSNPPRERYYVARSNDSHETDSKRNSIATLASHKSMPVLPRGPPPAPPPDCPLPQVPRASPDFPLPEGPVTSHINLSEPPPSPPPNCPLPQIPSISSHINPDDPPPALSPSFPIPQVPREPPDFPIPEAPVTSHINLSEPPPSPPPTCPLPKIPSISSQINPDHPPPAPPPDCPLPQIPPHANTHARISYHPQSPPRPLRRASQRSRGRVSRWMGDGNVPGMPDLSYGLDPNDERAKRESMINAF